MKKTLLLLAVLVACISIQAQQRISQRQLDAMEKNLKQTPLLSEDPDFNIAANAGKWNNESAVILCQKTKFDFDKKGISTGKRIGRNLLGLMLAPVSLGTSIYWANALNETSMLVEETERRKIVLKDKYSLDQYSILYFRFSAEGDAFAARVIKKDGSIQAVDLKDAVRVEDIRTVPSTFRSYTDTKVSAAYRPVFFKLPIPDLEEGDMIEYEFINFNTQEYSSNPSYKEFEPVYYVCNREMPVSRQIIEVVTQDDKYHIGYKSLKGAPEFVQTVSGGKKVYRWVDDNRDKREDTRFINEFIEQPSVKFQVTYARNKGKGFVWFKDESDMKRDLSTEELSEKVKTFWFNPSKLENTGDYTLGLTSSIPSTVEGLYRSLKKAGATDAAEDDYVRKAYYSIRGRTLYRNWSDFAFAKVFSSLLDRKKIAHEIIVSAPNHRTQLGKLAFTQEVAWAIKYKGRYYCNPNEHLNPEEVPVHLAGNACIRFDYRDANASVSDVIPVSDTTANVIATQINLTLDTSFVNLTVDKTVEAKGLVKDDVIDDVLSFTPFMESDYRNYDGSGMWEGLSNNEQAKMTEEFTKTKKEWKEEKPKLMKSMAESEYEVTVEKYMGFRVQQDGRSHKKRFIRYNEDFILTGLTAVAGTDIILSLPALIGQQAKIMKEERNRTVPIDVRYARRLLWHIVLPVPEGYDVKGIEALNKTVDNECGSFVTTAVLEDGKLIIDVKKMYKAGQFQTAQWNKMLEILDAAYNFSQSKIILKKK